MYGSQCSRLEEICGRLIDCNETKPRRTYKERRDNIPATGRKAFFLCVNKADVSSLMQSDKWPTDISISKWYFKSGQASTAVTDPVGATGAAGVAVTNTGDVANTGSGNKSATLDSSAACPSTSEKTLIGSSNDSNIPGGSLSTTGIAEFAIVEPVGLSPTVHLRTDMDTERENVSDDDHDITVSVVELSAIQQV